MPSPRSETGTFSSTPFIDFGNLLSGSEARKDLSTKSHQVGKDVTTKRSDNESSLKSAPSQQMEKTPSLTGASSSSFAGALSPRPAIPVTCDTTVSPCTTIKKGPHNQVDPSITTACNEDGSAVKPKLLFCQDHETTVSDTLLAKEKAEAPCTPVSTRRYQELPSSTDSSQDDLTLAEMELLVHRFGPPSRFSRLSTTNRSLSQALEGAENVNPQVNAQMSAVGIVSTSLNRCLPLVPTPTEYTGSVEEAETSALVEFVKVVNFPQYRWERVNSTKELEDKRHCVMCGNLFSCFKKKKDDTSNGTVPFILSDSKGICTSCEAKVWVVQSSSDKNAQIRWCQQCRKFHPFAAFAPKRGSSTLISSCIACREQKRARAKARREEKTAWLLNEKKNYESNGVDEAKDSNDSSVLGKRKSADEESVISVESRTKRAKTAKETMSIDESIMIEDKDGTSKESPKRIDTDADGEAPSLKKHSSKPSKEVSPSKKNERKLALGTITTRDSNEVKISGQQKALSSPDSHHATAPPGIATTTRNRCVPIPPDYSDNALEQHKNAVVPVFSRLANFSQCPGDRGTTQCVMCGDFRLSCLKKPNDSNVAFIPFGSKDVCSSCQDTEWLILKSQVCIKWCNQGSHFRPLTAFVGKKSAGKDAPIVRSCSACRDLAASYNHGK